MGRELVLTELQLLFWLHESNYGRLLLSSTWTWLCEAPGDLLLRFGLSYSPSVWSEILHLSLCQKTEKQNKQSCSSSLLKTPVAAWVHVWVCVCARLPFCFWRMSRVSSFTDVNKTNNFMLQVQKVSLATFAVLCKVSIGISKSTNKEDAQGFLMGGISERPRCVNYIYSTFLHQTSRWFTIFCQCSHVWQVLLHLVALICTESVSLRSWYVLIHVGIKEPLPFLFFNFLFQWIRLTPSVPTSFRGGYDIYFATLSYGKPIRW